jgi:hypothetical protein
MKSAIVFTALLALGAICAPCASALPPISAQKHQQGEFSFDTGPEPAFVSAHSIPDKWPEESGKAASVRWRNWLLDSQIDRRPGQDIEFHDQAFEAITAELVTDAGKYSIEFNPLYQKLTIHRVELRRDGVWSDRFDPGKVSLARRESGFEKDMSDGEVTAMIVLADVRANDVVRVAYSVQGRNPIIADSEQDNFHMAWTDPMLDRYVRVVYPSGQNVATKTFNSKLEVKTIKAGDHQEVLAHAHLTAGVRDEGEYPNWYLPYPMIQVAPKRSWSDVVAWALPLYPEPGALPAELQARILAWKKIQDPHARAFAVLRAVQDEVRYFGTELGDSTHKPADPSLTWQRRYGDCKDKAYLTSTLLRQVGIDSEPALVSMSDGRAVEQMLPSGAVFDHVIVRARIDRQTFWLDPTLTQQHGDLRQLDVRDYGTALPIARGVTALVPVVAPKTTNNTLIVSERYAPSASGDDIDLAVSSVYTGQRAENMRWRVNSEGLEELSRRFSDYYRKLYSNVAVVTPLGYEDAADGDRLVLTEHYLLKQPWFSKLGQVRQLELYADGISEDSALPQTVDRVGPLALSHPGVLEQDITVVLPKGWTVVENTPKTEIKAAEFAYSRTSSASDQSFELKHRFQILSQDVPPEGVNDYVREVRQVRDAIGARISIRVSAGVGSEERNERLQKLLRDAMDKKKEAGK